jgi:hypothetical protein
MYTLFPVTMMNSSYIEIAEFDYCQILSLDSPDETRQHY